MVAFSSSFFCHHSDCSSISTLTMDSPSRQLRSATPSPRKAKSNAIADLTKTTTPISEKKKAARRSPAATPSNDKKKDRGRSPGQGFTSPSDKRKEARKSPAKSPARVSSPSNTKNKAAKKSPSDFFKKGRKQLSSPGSRKKAPPTPVEKRKQPPSTPTTSQTKKSRTTVSTTGSSSNKKNDDAVSRVDEEMNDFERRMTITKARDSEHISSPCWLSRICQMIFLTNEASELMKNAASKLFRYSKLQNFESIFYLTFWFFFSDQKNIQVWRKFMTANMSLCVWDVTMTQRFLWKRLVFRRSDISHPIVLFTWKHNTTSMKFLSIMNFWTRR
jgi:hypothetical protein